MHIPDSMLQNSVCSLTLAASGAAVIAAAHFACKTEDKPTATRFGAVAALIFAAQMMNFPVMDGISGHLLGGVLAASLLGVPFGVLAMTLVVVVQALLLGDGGVAVIGANVFNIAVLGAGAGGMLLAFARRHGIDSLAATALAAWGSVMLAALAAGVEISLGGEGRTFGAIPAMLTIHAQIGVGEALLTVAACVLFSALRNVAVPFAAALVLATFSPFASALPDGLEWVAAQQGLILEVAAHPLHAWVPPAAAGLLGVLLSFVLAWGLSRSMGMIAAK